MEPALAFIEQAKKSPFYYSFYSVGIDVDDFIRSLVFFINRPMARLADQDKVSLEELVEAIYNSVPEFQRENDKWTSEMQSLFISNILQGCKASPIMLYTVDSRDKGKSFCKVLDGLQRITAIIRFFTDPDFEVSVGKDENKITLTCGELFDNERFKIHLRGLSQDIRVYDFKTEIEAVEHYIAINENMTHSSKDIEKAKIYLKKLKEGK